MQEAIIRAENEEYNYYDQVEEMHKNNIAEEIADCMVMLKQFKEYYKITDEEINEQIDYKVDRQLKRIEREVAKDENI